MVAQAGAKKKDGDQPEPMSPAQFRGGLSGHERDLLFYNSDRFERFHDIAYSLGLDFADDGRGFVPVDIDGDGDLDLATMSLQGVRLLLNPLDGQRRFARIALRATKSQWHALDANVTVTAGGVRQQDYVKLIAGFQSQVPAELHFGLDAAERIDAIEVRWPSGSTERFENLPVDRRIVLVEGEPATSAPLPAWPARPALAAELDLGIQLETVGGGPARLTEPGRPAVINFWAPWCEPCKRELPALVRTARAHPAVAFAGVSVETADRASVEAAIAAFGLQYPQYYAKPELLRSFFGGDGEAPLPSTFVFDARGKLLRAFRRAIEAAELEAVLATLAPRPPHVPHLLILGEAALRRGEIPAAIAHLEAALKVDPDSTFALAQYGAALISARELDRAISALSRAVAIDPSFPYAWAQLGLAYRRAGKTTEALAAYERASNLQPREASFLVGAATIFMDLGQHEKAAARLESIVAIDPRELEAWLNLGRTRMALGRPDAVEALRRALELDPTNGEVKRLLDAAARSPR